MLVPSTRPSNANTLFDFLGGKLAKDEKKEPAHSGGRWIWADYVEIDHLSNAVIEYWTLHYTFCGAEFCCG